MEEFMNSVKAVITGFVVVIVALLIYTTSYMIPAGHAGVIFDKLGGGVQEETIDQGWHVVLPWKKVTAYPISTEIAYYTTGEHEGRDKSDDSIVIGTKDGKTIKVDAQITYHMDKIQLPHVYNKFKGADDEAIEYGYMRQNFQRIANDISSHYSMMDIVGEKKDEFNQELYKAVAAFFDADGIYIEQASLGKVEPDDATKEAIQSVANAQYKQRQAEYEKVAAEAEAKTKVAKAQGDADAKKIQAEAEAYYNSQVAASLTPEMVQLEQVRKWDGKLPTYSGASNTLLNIGQ